MARNTNREANNYDQLLAGEVFGVIEAVIAASQTVKRGDLLELTITPAANTSTGAITYTVGTSYAKPAAAAQAANGYAVAAEDITTGAGATGKITAYKTGYFNQSKVKFGGSSTAADNKAVLDEKGIWLKPASDGTVSAS